MDFAMKHHSRRAFIASAAIATAAAPGLFKAAYGAARRSRVFIASNGRDGNGILAYDWDTVAGELTPAGVAAAVPTVDWLTFSHGRQYMYSVSEIRSFNGKPTGAVTSFRLKDGKLEQLSARNAASGGTTHIAVDHTGRMAVTADYGGGSAASFRITNGVLSELVWKEHYTEHGPKPQQRSAHAHFVSFSPDNHYVYINDLGGDSIHIYRIDPATAGMTPAGTFHAPAAGNGPRTLHFHPNGHTAYCTNEISSTVDVLAWNKKDGSLTVVTSIALLPADYKGLTNAADAVVTRDGRFVYFDNRGDNAICAYAADPKTGSLTPMGKTDCGGKNPRSFTLDPTERWMAVANMDSNWVSVFARNPETGVIATEGKNFPAAKPMCILFA
jgi:6-phosphogluconolactonase